MKNLWLSAASGLVSMGIVGCGGRVVDGSAVTVRGDAAAVLSSGDGAATSGLVGEGGTTAVGDAAASAGDAVNPEASVLDGPPDGAATPPLTIAGLALWLDGTTGVVSSDPRGGIGTWSDRSGLGHQFIGQTSVGIPPQPDRLAGSAAVAFNGHNRVIIEQFPTAAQQEALTFDTNQFAAAIAFQSDETLAADPIYPPGDQIWAAVMGPWTSDETFIASVLPPMGSDPFVFGQGAGDALWVSTGLVATSAPLPAAAPGPLHVALVLVNGTNIEVRVDGMPIPISVQPNSMISNFPFNYMPVYLGKWDFDLAGFVGRIGDFILVKGLPTSDLDRLESYLLAKYGL
jgi:hypothetical protein